MKGISRFSRPSFSVKSELSRLFIVTDSAPDASQFVTEPEFPEPESSRAPFVGPVHCIPFLLLLLDLSSDGPLLEGPLSVSTTGFPLNEPATWRFTPNPKAIVSRQGSKMKQLNLRT